MPFLLLIILLCLTLYSRADEPNRADLQLLQKKIIQEQQLLENKNNQKSKLIKQVRELELGIAANQKSIKKIKSDINQLNTALQKENKLIEQLSLKQKTLQRQVSEILKSQYFLLNQSHLRYFLSQNNTSKDQLQYYAKAVNENQTKLINQYQANFEQLQKNKRIIQQNRKKLKEKQQQLDRKQKQQALQHTKRSLVLADLNNKISSQQDQLKQLIDDRNRLENLLNSLEKEIQLLNNPSTSHSFASMQGKIPLPVKKQDIKQIFNNKNGVRFISPQGSLVRAVFPGQVVFAGWFRGKGLLLIIDHGDAFMSLYAHNETLLVETGDWVASSDNIATVGNSGGLEKSQLYFEIRHQGKASKAKKWLNY